MNPEKQEELIRNFTWEARTEKTIVREADLRKELQEIKERGYALSRGETTIGTAGISAPVFSIGEIEASLTIAGPDVRFDESRLASLGEKVKEKANRVSMLMGGHKWLL